MELVEKIGGHLGHGLEEVTLTTNGSQLRRYSERPGASRGEAASTCRSIRSMRSASPISPGAAGSPTCSTGSTWRPRPASRSRSTWSRMRGVNDDEIEPMLHWAHGRGFSLTLIEGMPLGEVGIDRVDSYLPLKEMRERLMAKYTLEPSRAPHRRAGALRFRGRDRRPGRLHHADEPQFLRELQPRAAHRAPGSSTCAWARTTWSTCAPPSARADPARSMRRSTGPCCSSPRGMTSCSIATTRRRQLSRHMSVTGG